jgi:hypothetical protein
MMKKVLCLITAAIMLFAAFGCAKKPAGNIPYWEADSPAAASVIEYVASVCDEKSQSLGTSA